jgi:hypothetical protein
MRIKEQETRLTLHEHDDDDDEKILKSSNLSVFQSSVISLSYLFSPVLLILTLPGHEIHDNGKG